MMILAEHSTPAINVDCDHVWRRLHRLEDTLDVVVFVRACSKCQRVEAKAGHRHVGEHDGWIAIEI